MTTLEMAEQLYVRRLAARGLDLNFDVFASNCFAAAEAFSAARKEWLAKQPPPESLKHYPEIGSYTGAVDD